LFYLFNPVKINFRGLSFSFIPDKFRGAFEIMELACAVSYTNRAWCFFFFCQLGCAFSVGYLISVGAHRLV